MCFSFFFFFELGKEKEGALEGRKREKEGKRDGIQEFTREENTKRNEEEMKENNGDNTIIKKEGE